MSIAFITSYVLLWLLVLTLLAGVFALFHHFGTMYMTSREGREDQGPEPGRLVEAFTAADITGRIISVPPMNRPLLLVFTSTTCKFCARLRPEFQRFVTAHTEVDLVVICDGHPRAVAAWAAEISRTVRVLSDPRARRSARYGVAVLPFAIAVGADGVVRGRGIVNDLDGLELLADTAVHLLPTIDGVPNET